MGHTVSSPTPPFRSAQGGIEVHQIPVWNDNLVWLAVCTETGAAAAIDGPEAAPVEAYAREHGIELGAIFNTHTHGDHIGINLALAKAGTLADMRVVGSALRQGDVPGITEAVSDGDTVTLGNQTGRVLLTEGHIDGHISFVFDDLLFCGDTLFGAGCGYLFDGPPEKMHRSLTRLGQLPEATRVLCAHEYTQDNLRFAWSVEPDNAALGERIRDAWAVRAQGRSTVPSTIDLERATNPFMRPHSDTIKRAVAAAYPDTDTDDPASVFAATRRLKDSKAYKAIEDADLPT